ncbi:hypothetical protein [Vibrio sp. SCSIO 43136]|uniref:hypothetical protein n=1 Tax=Vibrio sp. SCSIO 43136 TaxID=2819101 RepID=UPI0020753A2C|nr:hypothetical protein [Vibrio sp. SCSIO 43136]USD67073.1 hypothetical protein J4N39_20780 [Vibrio sp. SCSIO 43136]
MNKLPITLPLLASLAFPVLADEVNYGDPTASYTGLGLSRTSDKTQFNAIYGLGTHIFTADITVLDDKDPVTDGQVSARGRYFYLSDGLGYSLDIIGDNVSIGAIAGLMYKMQVTKNILVFPMAGIGYGAAELSLDKPSVSEDSMMNQFGIYGMYAFDSGNWVYANPKTTYINDFKTRYNELEIGGGVMIMPQASLGVKIEQILNFDSVGVESGDATQVWVNANYYF